MIINESLHPGAALRSDLFVPLGLTANKAATILRVSRQFLSDVINGKKEITPELAVRLELAFGGSAEDWLAKQSAFDLIQIRSLEESFGVKPYVANILDS